MCHLQHILLVQGREKSVFEEPILASRRVSEHIRRERSRAVALADKVFADHAAPPKGIIVRTASLGCGWRTREHAASPVR
jgi:hypothetical protein